MEENMNVNVGKNKKSIVPFLFVIIVILLLVLGVLLYDKASSNNEGNETNSVEKVESNLNNNQNSTDNKNETVENYTNKVQEAYLKIDKQYWASNKESTLLKVKNGKIVYSVSVGNEQNINFEYGKVKYAEFGISGGIPTNIIVLNENGEVYKIKFNDGIDSSNKFDQSKFTTNKIEFEEKVIDFTIAGGTAVVPYSGPYYLTESGKLLTENGTSYEEINRNHIARVGSLGQSVYINKDNTLEVLRVSGTNEYITIVDENGKKIRAKSVFYESSERWYGTTNDHFYVVDENDILLHFYEGSLMVADEYYDADGKIKVTNINYDDKDCKIQISFTDGKSITIEKVYQYQELDYKKVD